MAKNKFFYNRVYNVKKNIINAVIIGACIIGVIICFIFTSKFYGHNPNEPQGIVDIKSEVTVEINEKFGNDIFFAKLENISLDEINIVYPENYDISKTGRYNVTINIEDKKYESSLIVVDTENPVLNTKNVSINEGESYTANSFVSNCNDNSNQACIISFYENSVDEDGNRINYGNYKKSGAYNIKISAKDDSGNEAVKDATLTIKGKSSTPTPQQVEETCKYGDSNYDTTQHILAVSIASNNCAVSIDLYKDEKMTGKINKLMDTETTRIKKDVNALNLSGRLALNRQISTVFNTAGTGLVGYELYISVNVTNNGESKNVVTYKVNGDGKRVFTNNPYNLSN